MGKNRGRVLIHGGHKGRLWRTHPASTTDSLFFTASGGKSVPLPWTPRLQTSKRVHRDVDVKFDNPVFYFHGGPLCLVLED